MSTMTSEREAFEQWARENHFYGFHESMFAAWEARAHLAQPAQAVDVGAIREVIKRLEDHPLSDDWKVFDQCADKLTRALSGEKAGPVDVPYDSALNEAAWAFTEACPEKSALLFNNCKPSLKVAIEKWLSLRAIDLAAEHRHQQMNGRNDPMCSPLTNKDNNNE